VSFQMRRGNRREIDRPAWLDTGDGSPLLNCTLVDLSESGAKLAIEEAHQIPDTFLLLLTRHGQPRFSCRAVWRTFNAIGVEFASR
jgi:PilZ domain